MTMALIQPPPALTTLAELLPEFGSSEYAGLSFSGLQMDSRGLRSGELFAALPGLSHHGLQFVSDVIDRGAVGVLVDAQDTVDNVDEKRVPLIPVKDLRERLPVLARRLYGERVDALTIIGVTGTNGKTTCTQLIARIFAELGKPCGLVGTLGIGFPDALQTLRHTTPDLLGLYRGIADLADNGAEVVAMEVSSHALEQARCEGLEFSSAVLTNLSRDHLDYHGTMQAYAQSKQRLFEFPGLQCAVLNGDDDFGRTLATTLLGIPEKLVYAVSQATADVRATEVSYRHNGISAQLTTPWGSGVLNSALLGEFNLSNLLAAITVVCSQGESLQDVLGVVPGIKPVVGRMQCIAVDNAPSIVIDYAHTPDALEKALTALRPHCAGKLWCVFGCGGDRDVGKRPLMGSVAAQHADRVVVTSDNPRSENADLIIDDIVAGISGAVSREADRARAIQFAVAEADPSDWVLLAGKGHEQYQEIDGIRTPFNDEEQARQALTMRGAQS